MDNLKYNKEVIIRIIASKNNWIESEALEQLENTANLQGIKAAIAMPDLHPGKINPIGAAFISENWIYPQLVGNDIGCGMGLWKTNLKTQKLKIDKWASKLNNLDSPWDGNIEKWLIDHNIENKTDYDFSLGTIGGGNHFAELQTIESILDKTTCNELGINTNFLYLLVHSGSRGLGENILNKYIKLHGHNGLEENSLDAKNYITEHNKAIKWAEANRSLIMHRFISCLGGQGTKIIDINHNTVLPIQIHNKNYWIHRKGATPSTEGIVIIPGSRGDKSYLVQPIGSQEKNGYSLAHGAGRKWKRSEAKGKLSKYNKNDFIKTNLGSYVICENKNLIYEEAPQAYKKIDVIIQDLVSEGIIKVIAILRPVITYKTRKQK